MEVLRWVDDEASPEAIRAVRRRVGTADVLSRRVRRELDRHLDRNEHPVFCLRGNLSHSLIALERRLLIVKPGFYAGSMFGSSVTTFHYQDVTGIQVHTLLLTGWIEVSSPSFQGRERKHNRQPTRSDRDVYKLPNCVPIMKRHLVAYGGALAELRALVDLAKRPQPARAEIAPTLAAIERLTDLWRRGDLTAPEYERLKRLLLAAAGTPDGAVSA